MHFQICILSVFLNAIKLCADLLIFDVGVAEEPIENAHVASYDIPILTHQI